VHPDYFGTAISHLTTKFRSRRISFVVVCLLYRISNYFLFNFYSAHLSQTLKLAVVAFLERVKQIGRCVHLAVILNLFVTLQLDFAAVFERK